MNKTTHILIAIVIGTVLWKSACQVNAGQPANGASTEKARVYKPCPRSSSGNKQLLGAIIIGQDPWRAEREMATKEKRINADVSKIRSDSVSTDFNSGKTEFTGDLLIETSRYKIRATKAVVRQQADESITRKIRLIGNVRLLDKKTGEVQRFDELELVRD